MLKKRDLAEVPYLFDLLSHPDVFPYVRHKAETSDEFYFITKQTMEAEENGELISRTILDECLHPIGTINLFDIQGKFGFLATWIGQPYFGKGYNKYAKELFFEELFLEHGIEAVFMKIRKTNTRSWKAAQKLPYAVFANSIYPNILREINRDRGIYDLFAVTRESYLSWKQFAQTGAVAASDEEVS